MNEDIRKLLILLVKLPAFLRQRSVQLFLHKETIIQYSCCNLLIGREILLYTYIKHGYLFIYSLILKCQVKLLVYFYNTGLWLISSSIVSKGALKALGSKHTTLQLQHLTFQDVCPIEEADLVHFDFPFKYFYSWNFEFLTFNTNPIKFWTIFYKIYVHRRWHFTLLRHVP